MTRETIPLASDEVVPLEQIAPGVSGLRILFVNLFGVVNADGTWILIDTGLPLSATRTESWAEKTYGRPPAAIFLTHGHFDHVSGAKALADKWKVPVFAHPLELPFLTGDRSYPPPDPTVGGGVMALLSPTYPSGPVDLGDRLRTYAPDGGLPEMPEWKMIFTPGHTAGHVSFFRESDRALIVGDAFCTVQAESLSKIARMVPELHGPPAYYTPDWAAAKSSVVELAGMKPNVLIPGHGQPIAGPLVAEQLQQLADRFDLLALPTNRAAA